MKKSLSLLAAFLVIGAFSAPAQAADHYVSGFGGAAWINEGGLDAGFTGTGAIGCDYGSTRLEAEFGYQHGSDKFTYENNKYKVNADVYTLMANGYYDIDLGGVDLYLTAGLGLAQTDFSGAVARDEYGHPEGPYSNKEDQTSFAYQFGAGLAVPVADNIMLDARYRYFTTAANDHISSNSAMLGLRVGL